MRDKIQLAVITATFINFFIRDSWASVAAIAVALAGVAAFMYVGAVADNQGEALKAKLQQFEERIADLSLKAFGRK